MSTEAPKLSATEAIGIDATVAKQEPVSDHANALAMLQGIADAQKEITGKVESGLTAAIGWLKSQKKESVSMANSISAAGDTAQDKEITHNPLSSVLHEIEAIPLPPPGRRTDADRERQAAQEYLIKLLAENIILPRWINLRSRNNLYASRWGAEGLKWEKTSPDVYCVFETLRASQNSYRIRGDTGKRLNAWSWHLPSGVTVAATDDAHSLVFALTRLPDDGSGLDKFYSYATWQGNSGFLQGYNGPKKDTIGTSPSANMDSILSFVPYVTSSSIESIVYSTSNPSISPEPPLTDSFILNNCNNPAPATMSRKFTYTKSTVGSWSNTAGFSVSHEATFTAGVPLVAEGSVTIGHSFNASFTTGGESAETVGAEAEGSTTVPARSSMKAVLTVTKVKLDLHFTYRERLNYSNNTVGYRDGTGVYKNVSSYDGVVTFIPWTCPP